MGRKLANLVITFLILVLLSETVFAHDYHVLSSDFHEINETNSCSEKIVYNISYSSWNDSPDKTISLLSKLSEEPLSVPLDISQTRIENSTRIISSFGERKIGSKNAAEASLFIKNEMENAGLHVSFDNFSVRVRTRNFNYWNVSGANVVGVKEGNVLKDEIILVTAHYDSRILVPPKSGLRGFFDSRIKRPYFWPVWSDTYVCESANGTGADDNAGGVACMLELAKALQNKSLNRTIYFIAFSGEESNLLGSQAWVEAHPELKDNIVAVVNLDCVGNEPLCVCYLPQYAWLKDIFENEARNSGVRIQSALIERGDHEIFWENHIPAVVLCHHNYKSHDNFHKLSDTVDNIDFSVIRNASTLAARSVIYLADPDENQAPLVNVSNPEISEASFELIYNVSDPESTVEVFFDNQSLGNLRSGRTFSLPVGGHTIKVLATDRYGNRGTESINVVNKEKQSRSSEPPHQEIECSENEVTYVIGYPENYMDSNRTLYYYLDDCGPLRPENLFVLTPGSHNLKIWFENENGTLFMENKTSDFRKYSMERVQVDNPFMDRRNPLIFVSGVVAILAAFAFYGKWIKKRFSDPKVSKDEKK
ncbi:M28 family metallopeptidase [Methanosarcina barkeri]|uniref:Putative aminopeptidase n=1 Tax=Methanosarcina barkeri 227 TaxID=1434106 RepID=A0A0E3R0W9_METBA|nr:M20/M25/M40 family metallo-hydrolase [Methanosarcina barkeri]AKB57795.1 putative aminopeptidase [Methanosarcina barkeri 227]